MAARRRPGYVHRQIVTSQAVWFPNILLIGAAAVVLAGCAATTTTTPGEATYRRTVVTSQPSGVVTTETLEVQARGPGVTTPDPDTLKPGAVTASPDGADVGKSRLGFSVPSELTGIYAICAVAFLAGLALWWLVGWQLGALVCGGAVALLAVTHFVDAYPWAVGVPIALGLAAAAYLGWRLYTGQRAETGLKAVVTGVEDTPAEVASVVKAAVARAAGGRAATVTAAVRAAKVT